MQWKTTVVGLVMLIIPVLTALKWVTPDVGEGLLAQAPTLVETIFSLVSAIGGIFSIFKARDGKE